MDRIRNYLGMGIQKFFGLQAFEIAYLSVLAVLPWIVIQPLIANTILFTVSILIIHALYEKITFKKIEISDQVAFITGCDTGFGNSVARRLCGEGLTVIAGCYETEGPGITKLRSEYPSVKILKIDITDDVSAQKAYLEVEKVVKDKGLWALVNNAAIYSVGDVELSPLEEYRRLAEVNLFGLIRVTKQFLPLVRKCKGRVVNVTSSKGKLGIPGNSAFCMTKYGQEGFTDSLRLEMRKFGVDVITVEPGNFTSSTAMLSKNKMGEIETHLNKMWQDCPQEVKKTYGKKYIEGTVTSLKNYASKSCSSIAPVIDTIELAVVAKNPRMRYLVDGGSGLFDTDNLLIRLRSFVPESFINSVMNRVYNRTLPTAKYKEE